MHSKRSHEGYLLIDNRNGPGVQPEIVASVGLPLSAGQGLFEAPTITCSHCQTVVVINPNRTRERAYCQKCDHYVCDLCGLTLTQTGVCKPFEKLANEFLESAAKNSTQSIILS